MNKKLLFAIILLLLITGIGFLIWASIINFNHPLMDIARAIKWDAFKSSWWQYFYGFLFLGSAMVLLKKY